MLGQAGFVEGLIKTLLGQLIHAELQVLNLCDQAVLLKLHEHLLFHGSLVLVAQLGEGVRKLIVLLLLLRLIVAQLLLFLLNAAMVNLLEISLFTQLVIG